MKSLEIVDSNIKSIVDYLDNPQVKEDIDCLNIMCVGVSYKELQQIKQDLDVLGIINKKDVDIGYIKDLVKRLDDNEYILERYNEIVSTLYKLTLEELLKLKQWLEVNENE